MSLTKYRHRWLFIALLASCHAIKARATDVNEVYINSLGLTPDSNLPYVVAHCTACHSAALITQNRMTREGWLSTIRWMQEKQGLWPLGAHEEIVLNYLDTYYFPEETGRRKPLAKHLMPE